MSEILWGLGMLALIFAGDAAAVGLHYLCLAHPDTRTRAASTGVVATPPRGSGPDRRRAPLPRGQGRPPVTNPRRAHQIRGVGAAPAGAAGGRE